MIKNHNFFIGLAFILFSFTFSGYDYYQKKTYRNLLQKEEKLSFVEKSVLEAIESDAHLIKVQKKETLKSILKTKGLQDAKISKLLKIIKTSIGELSLKEGQELNLFLKTENDISDIETLTFKTSPECEITIKSDEATDYKIEKKIIELKKEIRFVSGQMNGTFINSVKGSGLPLKMLKTASVALGYVVNFQHDLKKGDTYQFLYEVYLDPNGKVVKDGNILYISLNAKGKEYTLYGYSIDGKRTDYFTKTGESVVRGFLQTPLDGRRVRVTSGFTLKGRMHPIKGFCRAHKGVDFGASYGTRVLAAADGTVVQVGYDGDYGNKITLLHTGNHKTVYAHLSKMNVKKGDHVKQRQVIGNVGSTGLSTGPHLHFEHIANNVHVNPMSVKQLPMQKLSGTQLNKFKNHIFAIEKEVNKQNPPTVTVVDSAKKT